MTILDHTGQQAFQAENAVAAIHRAREALLDPIFMDIQLPFMGGLKASWLFKASETTRHIPIYALTASSMYCDEKHIRTARCGATPPTHAYTYTQNKPESYKDLLATCGSVS